MVDVDDVDVLGPDRSPEPAHVARQGQRRRVRPQAQARQRIEAGFTRLGLEAVPGYHSEQAAVSPSPQALEQTQHGIGAAGPPSVRHEMQHGERGRGARGGRLHQRASAGVPARAIASSASRTSLASMPRRQGWSIGQVR
jgi:hypothetical protein